MAKDEIIIGYFSILLILFIGGVIALFTVAYTDMGMPSYANLFGSEKETSLADPGKETKKGSAQVPVAVAPGSVDRELDAEGVFFFEVTGVSGLLKKKSQFEVSEYRVKFSNQTVAGVYMYLERPKLLGSGDSLLKKTLGESFIEEYQNTKIVIDLDYLSEKRMKGLLVFLHEGYNITYNIDIPVDQTREEIRADFDVNSSVFNMDVKGIDDEIGISFIVENPLMN